jgi:diadenosine tetraphosphate (Ap4A) HIT family hydrolase
MNDTMKAFGWPETVLGETDHWVVMLRPAQPTLGACVLACKSDATALSGIPAEAHADMAVATAKLEGMLQAAVGYEKINYMMLMMVDPNVHSHVLPRYEGTKSHGDLEVPDAGWPALPQLGAAVTPTPEQRAALLAHLKAHWPE